jgi:hypothetical protein
VLHFDKVVVSSEESAQVGEEVPVRGGIVHRDVVRIFVRDVGVRRPDKKTAIFHAGDGACSLSGISWLRGSKTKEGLSIANPVNVGTLSEAGQVRGSGVDDRGVVVGGSEDTTWNLRLVNLSAVMKEGGSGEGAGGIGRGTLERRKYGSGGARVPFCRKNDTFEGDGRVSEEDVLHSERFVDVRLFDGGCIKLEGVDDLSTEKRNGGGGLESVSDVKKEGAGSGMSIFVKKNEIGSERREGGIVVVGGVRKEREGPIVMDVVVGGDCSSGVGSVMILSIMDVGVAGWASGGCSQEGDVSCAGFKFDTLEDGDGIEVRGCGVGDVNREVEFRIAVCSDFISGGFGQELAKSFRAFYVAFEEGGNGLENDAEFGEVGSSCREENVICVRFGLLEDRRGNSNFGEGRATLVVTEEDGIEDGGEDLVELGVNVVRSRCSSLVQ